MRLFILGRTGVPIIPGFSTVRALARKAACLVVLSTSSVWAAPGLFPAEFVYGITTAANGANFVSSVDSVCALHAQDWLGGGIPVAGCVSVNAATERYVIGYKLVDVPTAETQYITFSALRYYFCPDDISVGPTRELMCQSLGEQVIDPMKNLGALCRVDTPNPINSRTGNKYQIETDYSSPTGLIFKRVYNHTINRTLYRAQRTAQTPDVPPGPSTTITFSAVASKMVVIPAAATMTPHWQHHFQRSVALTSNGTAFTATLARPDGKAYMYILDNGLWKSDADVTGTLRRRVDANGLPMGWEHLNSDDETELYDATGKLLSITTRAGLTQTLTYDSQNRLSQVVDTFGRTLTLTYTAQNRLQTLTDPASGLYVYGYSATGNLITVTYPDGKVRTYLYENIAFPQALTGILDENGSRFSTYAYDSQGRAISSEHAGGAQKSTITYNANGSSTVTDALGTARTHRFQTLLGVVKSTGVTQPCASCGGDASNITYDVNGNIASQTDFNGNLTTYVYDLARNLEISRTEAFGTPLARTITTAWHSTFRLPTQITEPARVTTFIYDAQGNVTQKTLTAGALNRTWSYTYNTLGLVTSVNGPRTDVADISTYTYDAQGNLATATNALGHVTQITAYDAHGRPLTIQDPNGLITQLRYDARGRLITRFVGSELTQFQYDGVGQLTRLILPDSSFMDYTYDAAHRLTAMTDALGNKISYTLDALGNRLKEEVFDPSNTLTQQRRRVFDSLNRLAQDIGAQNQITSYQYDANGNLLSTTDPLVHTTVQAYDALNRLVQITDPANGIATYTYDANDRLTQVMDPRTIGTAYTYDGLDNLTQSLSLDAGTTTRTYDTAGNLATQTDARNKKTVYTYDALNRLLQTTYADTSRDTYQYDQGMQNLGRLTQVTNGSGTTAYTYNSQGYLLSQKHTHGTFIRTFAYTYDASGRISQVTYPSGKVISYGYDLAGRIAQLNVDGQPLLSAIRYQPYGAVKEWTWRTGTLHTRAFDQDGRIVSHPQGTSPVNLSYDTASRLVQQAQGSSVQSYGYDTADRLTQHVDPTGLTTSYQYDANGNRTQQSQGAASTSYAYPVTSNRLLGQSGASTLAYTYDAMGNLVNDGTRSYGYDVRGRLAYVKGLTVTDYDYNAYGQRTRKVGTADTRYIYDPHGHLIGEYLASGVMIQETVYLGDLPVAVLTPAGTYNLHADHLNTPRAITDSSHQVIWRWDSDPFGTTLANEDPDGNGAAFTYNPRFPGQYFDKETGLHYNYFRDYDPKIGRYIQSDPIGLSGGLNPYIYAANSPLRYIDPRGLLEFEPPINPQNPTLDPNNPSKPKPPVVIPQQPIPEVPKPRIPGRSCEAFLRLCTAACASPSCPPHPVAKVGCVAACVALYITCKAKPDAGDF